MASPLLIERQSLENGEGRSPSEIPTSVFTGIARIAGAKVHFTFETPYNQKDITDPRPLEISHGWMGPEDAYDPLRQAVVQSGKPAITYNAARSRGLIRDLNPLNYHWSKVAEFTSKVAWGPLREIKEELGIEKFDAYGHSLGGQTVVNLATHKPEHIQNVVLDGSCGLDFHDLGESWSRSKEFVKAEFLPSRGKLVKTAGPELTRQAVHYIFRNPALTLVEGLNAGSTNLHGRIHRLHEKGIGVAALQAHNDVFSPAEKVLADCDELLGAHMYTREHTAAGHLDPQLDPYGTAKLILRALAELRHPQYSDKIAA
jgi:pimeloyl-ACP methyl ester carboxylesterase